jgi:hypothetical protein
MLEENSGQAELHFSHLQTTLQLVRCNRVGNTMLYDSIDMCDGLRVL